MPLKACISRSRFLLISPRENSTISQASSIFGDNNVLQIRELLSRGEDPNYKCEGKLTPFQTAVAIYEDNVAVVRELIGAGADVNLADCFLGYTPLHYAVQQGKLLVIIALFKSGAFVNVKDLQGKTPLHYAVTQHIRFDPRIIKKILDHEDIDCNAVDSNGDTALMLAVKSAQTQSVVMLLHNKAKPNICNNNLSTPLHEALARQANLIQNELMLHGASIYAKDKYGITPIDILIMNLEIGILTLTIDILVKVKIIAFNYSASKDLKCKFLKNLPKLHQYFEKCCEEVNRMKSDHISNKLTVHDFFSRQLIEDRFDTFNLHIHKPVVERLTRDIYPEYFYDILKIIPRSSLLAILETFTNPKIIALIICLVSNWLTDLDLFRLILAFSNVKITESMRNLDVREICAIHSIR